MRNFILVAFLAIFITGCAQFAKTEPTGMAQRVIFSDGIELVTTDMFDSALMKDKDNNAYYLTRKPSANGIYMEDKNGVNIHFKGRDGIVEFSKNKTQNITVKEEIYLN